MKMKRNYVAVTTNGECIKFETGLGLNIYSKRKNIELAVVYSAGKYPCGISTKFQTWNGKDHGIFNPYIPDARINRTPEDCIKEILNNCN